MIPLLLSALVLSACFSAPAHAQDVARATNHPMLTRTGTGAGKKGASPQPKNRKGIRWNTLMIFSARPACQNAGRERRRRPQIVRRSRRANVGQAPSAGTAPAQTGTKR
jgi:hypothetical protein